MSVIKKGSKDTEGWPVGKTNTWQEFNHPEPTKNQGKDGMAFYHSEECKIGQSGGTNMNASARSLAKLGAYVVNGGTFEGKKLLSEEGVAGLCANPTRDRLWGLEVTTNLT